MFRAQVDQLFVAPVPDGSAKNRRPYPRKLTGLTQQRQLEASGFMRLNNAP